ncbi:MAG: hypothetical protein C4518_04965 [Desulfobacteraceae bacterium]|nr:MAG: hypothetical protein C4518_04965 [Desulfobacteraceae bacterium]
MKPEKLTVLRVLAACLLMFGGFACNSIDNYAGKYQAVDITESGKKINHIELMENGEGAWTCCDGEVLFTWYVKNKELRINTKEGGIMVGKLENSSFTIALPGKKILTFVKVSSQE